MKHAANFLTADRMVLALVLLAAEPLSPAFLALYTAAGITDMLDGPVARGTGGASAFGARLDSAADLVFFTAAAIRLLPCLWPLLPPAVRLGTLAAAFLRGAVFTLCLLRLGCVPALHTRLNKLAGAGLFCLPYFIGGCLGWYAPVLCLLALLAAGKDLRLVCQGKSRAEECFQWRDFRWR